MKAWGSFWRGTAWSGETLRKIKGITITQDILKWILLFAAKCLNRFLYEFDLEERWERFLAVRENVLKALEEKREKKEIGNSLEAEVELVASKETKDFLQSFKEDLPGLFLVSGIRMRVWDVSEEAGVEVLVSRAVGKKCERCWNWKLSVGQDASHPTLCSRCAQVVKGV